MATLPKGQGVIPLPPFKAWLASNIPAVYDNTMTYYEELCALLKYLQDQVVPALNENASAITILSNYVENYFNNLDVQEEINNKLDEMAEDGTLQEIIAQYIQANTAWCFDTVADMKSATNLVDGSYAQTLGYHTKNDGGKSLYKIREITNADVVNEGNIIALNDENLVAELILSDSVDVIQFGAYGDNTHDDTTAFQNAFNFASSKRIKVNVGAGVFKFTDELTVPSGLIVNGNGTLPFSNDKGSVLIYTGNDTFITTQANTVLNNFTVDLSNSNTANGISIKSSELHNINVKNGNVGFMMGDTDSPSNLLEKCLAFNCNTGYKLDSTSDDTKYCNNTVLLKCHANGCNIGVHINCYDIRCYDLSINDTKAGGTALLLDGRAVACYFSGTYFENPLLNQQDIVLNSGASRNEFAGFRNFGWLSYIVDNSGQTSNIFEGYRIGNPALRYTEGKTASKYVATWATADKNRIFGMTFNGTDNNVVEKVLEGGGTVIKNYDSSVTYKMQNKRLNCRTGYNATNLGFIQTKPSSSLTSITVPAGGSYTLSFASSYYGTQATTKFIVGVDVSNNSILTSYRLDGTTLKVSLYNPTGSDIILSDPQNDVKINLLMWE